MSQVKTDKGNVEIKNKIWYKGGTPNNVDSVFLIYVVSIAVDLRWHS